MTKFFCDACGSENKIKVLVKVPTHIVRPTLSSYVDADGNEVSGRDEDVELCPACANLVWKVAWGTLEGIRKGVKP